MALRVVGCITEKVTKCKPVNRKSVTRAMINFPLNPTLLLLKSTTRICNVTASSRPNSYYRNTPKYKAGILPILNVTTPVNSVIKGSPTM